MMDKKYNIKLYKISNLKGYEEIFPIFFTADLKQKVPENLSTGIK